MGKTRKYPEGFSIGNGNKKMEIKKYMELFIKIL